MEEKVIRCVGDPLERFTEDALRILRAVRFAAQLGFSIEERTREAIGILAGNLEHISAERIQAELVKLAVSPHPEEMEFSPEALASLDALMEDGYEPGRLLSVLLPWRDFHLPPKTVWDRETYLKAAEAFQTYRPLELKDFQNALSAVWDDLEEFPVSCEPTYEDSWLFERSFGGERHHEGCDLMPLSSPELVQVVVRPRTQN